MGQVGSNICGFLKGGAKKNGSCETEMSPQGRTPVYAMSPAYAMPPAPGPVAVPVAVPVVQPVAVPMQQPQVAPMATAVAATAVPVAQSVAVQQPPQVAPVATAMAATAVPIVAQGVVMAKPGAVGMVPQVAGAPVPGTGTRGSVPGLQPRVELPGKRKSLLVGINYFGTRGELNGCIADVKRMRPVLEQRGFPSDEQHQMVLLDEPGGDPMRRPTLANMRRAIRWLTCDAHTGDALFFHYSGHGGREEDPHAASGYVETLCPEDHRTAGMLLDTELFETLVRPLPSGCRLTCLMDCCHSGGVLNLPYMFTGTPENLRQALSGQAMDMAMSKDWLHNLSALKKGNPMAFIQDAASMGLGLWGLWKSSKTADETGFMHDEQDNVGLAVGEVVAITGCRSDQTSSDVGNVHNKFDMRGASGRRSSLQMAHRRSVPNTAAGGALTSVFMESLQAGEELSYYALLERIRARLEEEDFDQVPQLATSLLIELQQPFSLTTISLPAKPNTKAAAAAAPGTFGGGIPAGGASGFGGGGFGAGAALGGVAAAAGTSALLAGFMASMAGGNHGPQLLQSARGTDGSAPYATLMGGMGGGMGANHFYRALQEDSGDDDWWQTANRHVRSSLTTVNVTEVNQYNVREVNQYQDNSYNEYNQVDQQINIFEGRRGAEVEDMYANPDDEAVPEEIQESKEDESESQDGEDSESKDQEEGSESKDDEGSNQGSNQQEEESESKDEENEDGSQDQEEDQEVESEASEPEEEEEDDDGEDDDDDEGDDDDD